jgi:hypothetical protein
MKMKFFNILMILFIVASCSKTAGKTEAKLKISMGAMMDMGSVGAGGAMLWGRNDKGDMFGEVLQSGADITLELDNGAWTFWSVAWDGLTESGSKVFGGKSRCAKTYANLNGSDIQLNISLGNDTCAEKDFSPAVSQTTGPNEFPSIALFDCDKISDHNGMGCGKNRYGGRATSKKLILAGFNKSKDTGFKFTGGSLTSECHAVDTDFAFEHLPVGDGNMPVFTVLESFFSSTDCNALDPKGSFRDHFEFGLLATPKLSKLAFVNNGSCDPSGFSMASCEKYNGTFSAYCTGAVLGNFQTRISEAACVGSGGSYTYTTQKTLAVITAIPDEVLCSDKRIDSANTTPHPFAAGLGTINSPYKICNEVQMNSIGSSFSSGHFSLVKDLDMDRTSVFGDLPKPPCTNIDLGINFVPIGGLRDPGDCSLVTATTFAGSFNGNNHSISNIRLNAEADNMGFARQGGDIQNLTLININIEGVNNVGAFSGDHASKLFNLNVIEGKIRGKNYVGGIAGIFADVGIILEDLHAKKLTVKSNFSSSFVGGLIGTTAALSSFNLKKSSFEGIIQVESNNSNTGGLVGFSSSPNIVESFSTGAIITTGNSYAGGLVGYVGNNLTVTNSYSKMSIGPASFDITTTGAFGGIAGKINGNAILDNSFYLGTIMLPCRKDVLNNCDVGALLGLVSGSTSVGTSAANVLVNSEWYNSIPLIETAYATFISLKNGFVTNSLGAFVDPGGVSDTVMLAWEKDVCSKTINQLSVSVQVAVAKGTLANPVVICNRQQFREIKNFPSAHYLIESNIVVGPMISASSILDFSGSINGNENIISGIYHSGISTNKGLIEINRGTLSHLNFAASQLIHPSGSAFAGIVGTNEVSGVIEHNKFLSINIQDGLAYFQGVIAGINNGLIFNNKVSSNSQIEKTTGIGVGKNNVGGTIIGLSVDGQLKLNGIFPGGYGGVAGVNEGVISESSSSVSINNKSPGNSSSAAYIGALVGSNNGLVKDSLVTPNAKINLEITGPFYGQVFGNTESNSDIRRVVAANEAAISESTPASLKSFVNTTAGTYINSYILKGSTFKFRNTNKVVSGGCSPGAGKDVSYYFAGINFDDLVFPDGLYAIDVNNNYITKRISKASYSPSALNFFSFSNGEFIVPCEVGGITNLSNLRYIQTIPDFADTNVLKLTPFQFQNFQTFCSSSNTASAAEKLVWKCDPLSNELDIVSDQFGGTGSLRLINAYKTMLTTKKIPVDRPIWTLSPDDQYPRLFLAD